MYLPVQIHIFMHLQINFLVDGVKFHYFIGFTALMTSR